MRGILFGSAKIHDFEQMGFCPEGILSRYLGKDISLEDIQGDSKHYLPGVR